MSNNWVSIVFISLTFIAAYSQNTFPHKIWLYWNTEYSHMPEFYTNCVANIERTVNNTDWIVYKLKDSNLQDYLSYAQLQMIDKYFAHKDEIQMRSDFVRLAVLKKYGGVYLDVNGYLVQNLDWLDTLKSNPHEVYKINGQIEVLMFGWPYFLKDEYMIERSLTEEDLQNSIFTQPHFESAFIAAHQNSTFINEWFNTFVGMLQETMVGIRRNYWLVFRAYDRLIKNKILELKEKKRNATFYEEYRLGLISVSKGFYGDVAHYPYSAQGNSVQLIAKHTMEELKEEFSFEARYYVKENHYNSQFYLGFFSHNNYQLYSFSESYYKLYYQILYYFRQFLNPCLISTYVVEGSILETYLKPNNTEIQYVPKQALPFICRWTTFHQLYQSVRLFLYTYAAFSLIQILAIVIDSIGSCWRNKRNLQPQQILDEEAEKIKCEVQSIGQSSIESCIEQQNQTIVDTDTCKDGILSEQIPKETFAANADQLYIKFAWDHLSELLLHMFVVATLLYEVKKLCFQLYNLPYPYQIHKILLCFMVMAVLSYAILHRNKHPLLVQFSAMALMLVLLELFIYYEKRMIQVAVQTNSEFQIMYIRVARMRILYGRAFIYAYALKMSERVIFYCITSQPREDQRLPI